MENTRRNVTPIGFVRPRLVWTHRREATIGGDVSNIWSLLRVEVLQVSVAQRVLGAGVSPRWGHGKPMTSVQKRHGPLQSGM